MQSSATDSSSCEATAGRPPKVYVAISIEKGGDAPVTHPLSRPLLAIGACVGTNGSVIERRRWCLAATREGESQHEDRLARIAAESVDPLAGLADFNVWLVDLQARYFPAEIGLLSDDPAYDIGQLDHELNLRGIRTLPLRALGDGKYRTIANPCEMAKGQGLFGKVFVWAIGKAGGAGGADPWPENFAELIYWQHVGACRIRDQLVAGARLADVALGD